MNLRLRTAAASDRDAVTSLLQSLYSFEAPISADRRTDRAAAEAYYRRLQMRLTMGQGRIILAEADGQVVGLMSFVVEMNEPFVQDDLRRHALVTDLVVQDGWRGQGIGRTLLGEAERMARAAGVRRLLIGVLSGNAKAVSLYEDYGFRDYARVLSKSLD